MGWSDTVFAVDKAIALAVEHNAPDSYIARLLEIRCNGGRGSGHWGHSGGPGLAGGSGGGG